MKTQTLKSLASLLGVAVALNASVLAGPGPLVRNQTRTVEPKSTAVPVTNPVKVAGDGKSIVVSRPKLTESTGPHGVTFSYRRTVASTR